MSIIEKVIGIIICIIGLAVWYIDYIVFTAVGALVGWIAGVAGITGLAVLGLQIIGWMLTLSLMILIFMCGLVVFGSGLKIVMGD